MFISTTGCLEMRKFSVYRKLSLIYTVLYAKQPSYLYDIIKLKNKTC